jgi:hypothetical protein
MDIGRSKCRTYTSFEPTNTAGRKYHWDTVDDVLTDHPAEPPAVPMMMRQEKASTVAERRQ